MYLFSTSLDPLFRFIFQFFLQARVSKFLCSDVNFEGFRVRSEYSRDSKKPKVSLSLIAR